jgi:hypothetical protein
MKTMGGLRLDIALSVLVLGCGTSRPPAGGDARGVLRRSVPSSVSALVGRFCALVPAERPRNGRTAAEEIEAALATADA